MEDDSYLQAPGYHFIRSIADAVHTEMNVSEVVVRDVYRGWDDSIPTSIRAVATFTFSPLAAWLSAEWHWPAGQDFTARLKVPMRDTDREWIVVQHADFRQTMSNLGLRSFEGWSRVWEVQDIGAEEARREVIHTLQRLQKIQATVLRRTDVPSGVQLPDGATLEALLSHDTLDLEEDDNGHVVAVTTKDGVTWRLGLNDKHTAEFFRWWLSTVNPASQKPGER